MLELDINIDIYSGSFQKLVELIKEKKISVRNIPVSKIADLFNEYIQKNKKNLKNVGEFMRLASYLTFLKSKELLPRSSKDNELRKHKDFLYNVIEDYELLKKTSNIIKNDFGTPRTKYIKIKNINTPNKENFSKQLELFFSEYISIQEKLEIIREVYTVEKAMEKLSTFDKISIYNLYEISEYNKLKFIVYFLGALTLVRNNIYKFESDTFIKAGEKIETTND
ncbi:hypothetical protein OSSY52_12110 [Tepiditoga spiralis]|uniref:Segregation and condensation protein A n=1 Tax=Tepiditoga spiralis TaxID=2108365 RepID=A0A7G1G3Q5_9BACT|nr:segregation/condensation protein A [Tepiditoga spiralis]BBE31070.1 hypothetical protein OSSY52_12110 [Tepiditoga spiralis]